MMSMRRMLTLVLVSTALSAMTWAADKPRHVIADFTDEAAAKKVVRISDEGGITTTIEPRSVTDTNQMYKVVFNKGQWPGFNIRVPKDWSRYEAIKFTVWSKTKFTLHVRIDDAHSNSYQTRFNKTFKLEPGRNRCQLEVELVKTKINVNSIRAMILFTSKPPKGLALFFDDIELGPVESEQVPFIPYEKRKDLQPTLDVVTPHLAMAKPLAGGPLRAFLLTSVAHGREVVEMMQRMAYKVSVMTWDKSYDTNTWGMGDFYGKRGHKIDYVLMQRYLASSMLGPEKFDVLVLNTPQGWKRFPQAAKEALLKRVKENGEGLVFVFPYPGEEKKPWPDDLRELNALIDSDSDYPNESGYVRYARSGRVSGKKWVKAGKHPITEGVPLEALPFRNMTYQKYKSAPGAEVLIKSETGDPILAVKTLGKGRVVTCAWRARSLTPEIRQSPGQRLKPYRYWEVLYSLMNRAAQWAAKRDFKREGQPVDVKAEGQHADGNLKAKQWKNGEGQVTDWELVFTPPGADGITPIEVKASANVKRGAKLTVTLNVPGDLGKTLKPEQLNVCLGEKAHGRWRTLETATPTAKGNGAFEASFSTARVRQILSIVKAEVKKDGAVVGRGNAEVVVTPEGEPWTDYEILMWNVNGLPFLQPFEGEMIRVFGATGLMETGSHSSGVRMRWSRAGLRLMPHAIAGRQLHLKTLADTMDKWNKTRDRKLLIRNPSYADPVFLKKEMDRFRRQIKALQPFFPTNYVLCDEPSLTSYRTAFDFDFHPENIKAFRNSLKERFKTIEDLNKALGEKLKSFDAIQAPHTSDARKAGRWGLWNEWRDHNDALVAEGYKRYLDIVREIDPRGTISVSGTQVATPYDGFDWGKLSPLFGTMQGYGYAFQERKRMSFNPEMINAKPAGYGRKGRAVDYQIWTCLVDHGGGHVLFWWIAFRNPDLSFCQSARDYIRIFKEMRSGIGRQYLNARRKMSPIAVVYSMDSLRAAFTTGRDGEFRKSENNVVNALVGAGFDPQFVTDAQVAAGDLTRRGFKAVFLPMTISVGQSKDPGGSDMAGALAAFAKAGGLIAATHDIEFDEFLKKAPAPEALKPHLKKFDEIKGNLAEALAAKGVRTWVKIVGEDGKPVPKVTFTMHRLKGEADANLLTILRPPIGTKEVLGSDGVLHTVPDKTGGKDIEKLVVDVSGYAKARFYDIRRRSELKPKDGKLHLEMKHGDGYPVAILPYAIEAVKVKAQIKDRALEVSWTIEAKDKKRAAHAVRIAVLEDNSEDPALSQNATTGADGTGQLTIPLADEDKGKKLTIRVHDILSGKESKTEVEFK